MMAGGRNVRMTLFFPATRTLCNTMFNTLHISTVRGVEGFVVVLSHLTSQFDQRGYEPKKALTLNSPSAKTLDHVRIMCCGFNW